MEEMRTKRNKTNHKECKSPSTCNGSVNKQHYNQKAEIGKMDFLFNDPVMLSTRDALQNQKHKQVENGRMERQSMGENYKRAGMCKLISDKQTQTKWHKTDIMF